MGIKLFQTRDELEKKIFTERKLKNKKKYDFKKIIARKNYFRLFNGFESLLLNNRTEKKYEKEDLDHFIKLHNFDHDFSSELFSILRKFETHLKSSISYHFSMLNCNTLNTTMNYTNIEFYREMGVSTYFFGQNNNKKICLEKNIFLFFAKGKGRDAPNHSIYLNKLIDQNRGMIDPDFYKDEEYAPIGDVSKYTRDEKVAVPLWVAIQTINFGQLKRLCHYLKDDVMDEVLKDFGMVSSDRELFLNSLDIIHVLRNECAHFTLINRFKTEPKIKLRDDLIDYFNLTPENPRTGPDNYSSVIYLFDSLSVLGNFQSLKSLKKILRKIHIQNEKARFTLKYSINDKLLTRMGNRNIKDWYKMLDRNIDL